MAALTIRNIDDAVKQALRIRAAKHGVSMEEEARRILGEALQPASSQQSLGQRLKQRFAPVADPDFEIPPRQAARKPPDWSQQR